MFITVFLIVAAFLFLITLRDFIYRQFLLNLRIKIAINKTQKYIVLQNWNAAKKELRFILSKKKKNKALLLLELAVLRGTGEFAKALVIAKDALHANPEELLFLQEQGRLYLALQRYKEAWISLKGCLMIIRSEDDLLDYLEACLKAPSFEEGWAFLQRHLNSLQSERALSIAGDYFLEKKEFETAILLYEKAKASPFSSEHLNIKLGHAYRRLGNLQKAEAIFTVLLNIDSSNVDATLGLGAVLRERGEYQKALLLYQSGRAWEKKDPSLLHEAALLAIATNRYTYAISYIETLLEQNGPTYELLTYLGFCLEQEEHWEQAEETYIKLLQHFPKDPNGYIGLSWLFGVGRSQTITPEKARELANKAVDLSPTKQALEILSACEARLGNFEKAHQIQEYLAQQEGDISLRNIRHEAMRRFRRELPLEEIHLPKRLVA